MLDLASYYQVYNFSHLAAIHRASHGSRKLYFNLLYLYNINQNFEALLEMTYVNVAGTLYELIFSYK